MSRFWDVGTSTLNPPKHPHHTKQLHPLNPPPKCATLVESESATLSGQTLSGSRSQHWMRATYSIIVTSGLLLAAAPSFATPPHHSQTNTHANVRHSSVKTTHKAEHTAVHHEPVQGMATDRATQIQSALIKAGYLTGEPSGSWDSESVAAMQKLQGDNGWQTKLTPDSRALIKLGLGPQQ